MKLELLCFQKLCTFCCCGLCCSHDTSEIISNNNVIKMSTVDCSKDLKPLNTYQYFVTEPDICSTKVNPAIGQICSQLVKNHKLRAHMGK